MYDHFERLLRYWLTQEIIPPEGNDEETIARFEARNALRLPTDMRQYLSVVNGMTNVAGSDTDMNGFRFWPLQQIRSVPVACADADVTVPSEGDIDRFFVFADYLDWSWAYAIDLSGKHANIQSVIHVGTLEPKIVARSFGEFVTHYLADAKVLYVEGGGR